MVASDNMTEPNLYTYYSSVISLCSMWTILFLDELDNINICTGDIINDYITACTTEKIFFNAGPEFTPFGHAVYLLLIKTYI